MKDLALKYGCNPNQKPSRIFVSDGSDLPIEVLNGRPGYINFMDALNGWQLVRDLKAATGLPAATSFKHVSPAGAAVGLPLTDVLKKIYFVDDMEELSPLACAYARARGADRMSSFGDFISLSDVCDASTAKIIKREVSDGVIAPGYTDEALEILKAKKNGNYNVIKIDPEYVPQPLEHKEVFGITFEQGRNELAINNDILANVVTQNKDIPDSAKRDLVISLITLKYTQSNSVCYAYDGQAIGVGTISAVQTVTMQSTYISAMSTWMFLQTAHGRRSSRRNRKSSRLKRREHGLIRLKISHSVPMHSSRSPTISSALRRAVSSILQSRADLSATMQLLSAAISMVWQWPSQESVCSITEK